MNVFRMSRPRIQMLSALRILLRNTVDSFVDYAIAAKLKAVLSVGRVAYICKLLEGNLLLLKLEKISLLHPRFEFQKRFLKTMSDEPTRIRLRGAS